MSFSSLWDKFWSVHPIQLATINQIDNPLIGGIPFLTPIYIILAVIFVIDLMIRYRGKRLDIIPRDLDVHLTQGITWQTWLVIQSLIIATVAAGTLFAFRMDYGWYKIWRLDQGVTSSQTADKNTLLFPRSLNKNYASFQGTLYDFAQEFKKRIPSNDTVKIVAKDSFLGMALKYYLLPYHISENEDYIIAFNQTASYDPRHHVLLHNGIVIERNVSNVFTYRSSIFVLKKHRDN
jgi:hypothetical protein